MNILLWICHAKQSMPLLTITAALLHKANLVDHNSAFAAGVLVKPHATPKSQKTMAISGHQVRHQGSNLGCRGFAPERRVDNAFNIAAGVTEPHVTPKSHKHNIALVAVQGQGANLRCRGGCAGEKG